MFGTCTTAKQNYYVFAYKTFETCEMFLIVPQYVIET